MSEQAPPNISWLVEKEVAGCARPWASFELRWMKDQGIKHILCLSYAQARHDAEIVGLKLQIIDIPEFEGPSEATMQKLVAYLKWIKSTKEVLFYLRGYLAMF